MEGTTYEKKGHLHGHFSNSRFDRYDKLGRQAVTDFFTWKGAKVSVNDMREDGSVDYMKADMRAEFPDNNLWLVEAAVKNDDLWKYIYSGVDVETRKRKYIEQKKCVVLMANSSVSEALVIPMQCLQMAQESCGEEYKGHNGRRKVADSANFVMPAHGCHRVRKFCINPGGSLTLEDFYRIPYRYVAHYRVVVPGKQYELIKPSEWKRNNAKARLVTD